MSVLGVFAGVSRHLGIWREAAAADRARPKAGREALERQFLPAAVEIMETPASPVGRATVLALCAFFAVGVAWACWGTVDVVAVATGKVIPESRIKTIQALEIGVVRAIHVANGQTVRAGDPLIDLDSTDSTADIDRLTRESMALRLDLARFEALLEATTTGVEPRKYFRPPEGVDGALAEAQRRLMTAQWLEHRAKISAFDGEVERRKAELRGAETEIAKFRATIPMMRDRAVSLKGLAAQGYSSRLRSSEVQQQLIEGEQGLDAATERKAQAGATIAAAEQQRRQASEEFRIGTLKEVQQATEKLAALEQEMLKLRKRRALQRLTAPVDGIVQQLQVHTLGGIIKAADPLMVIVPSDAVPEVEAQILNKDIGFVRAGQAVEVKFEALPFTRYGTVEAEILHVSHDAVSDEKLGLVYPARIKLKVAWIDVDGRKAVISPGMVSTIEIRTGERRVIEYLLSPLLRYRAESLRER